MEVMAIGCSSGAGEVWSDQGHGINETQQCVRCGGDSEPRVQSRQPGGPESWMGKLGKVWIVQGEEVGPGPNSSALASFGIPMRCLQGDEKVDVGGVRSSGEFRTAQVDVGVFRI